uniref:Uncharacterized protein n=1 Tax=Timema bartmani TaxID=61472 RepID=A0A7R9I4H9_9NEOP|nr:unnamed protein product [Timema bartmani]
MAISEIPFNNKTNIKVEVGHTDSSKFARKWYFDPTSTALGLRTIRDCGHLSCPGHVFLYCHQMEQTSGLLYHLHSTPNENLESPRSSNSVGFDLRRAMFDLQGVPDISCQVST